MVVTYMLSFLSGVYTKISDSGSSKIVQAVGGFLSGVFAYTLAVFCGIAEIVTGTIIGNVLAGKVDKQSHYILVSTYIFFFALYGVPLRAATLLLFTAAAYMDEVLSERKDLLGKRILLPLAALFYAVVDVNPFIYLLLWEAGYRSTSYLIKRR